METQSVQQQQVNKPLTLEAMRAEHQQLRADSASFTLEATETDWATVDINEELKTYAKEIWDIFGYKIEESFDNDATTVDQIAQLRNLAQMANSFGQTDQILENLSNLEGHLNKLESGNKPQSPKNVIPLVQPEIPTLEPITKEIKETLEEHYIPSNITIPTLGIDIPMNELDQEEQIRQMIIHLEQRKDPQGRDTRLNASIENFIVKLKNLNYSTRKDGVSGAVANKAA